MESSLQLTTFDLTPTEGFVYCVYDAGLYFDPTAPLHIKCGRTKHDVVSYCGRTYARHMAKLIIECVSEVSDTVFAETLLFRILARYRINARREVFHVPNISVAHEAFKVLSDCLTAMHRVDPAIVVTPVPSPSTVVGQKVDKKAVRRQERLNQKLLKKEALLEQKISANKHVSDKIQHFIQECCETGSRYFVSYKDFIDKFETFNRGERIDSKKLKTFMEDNDFRYKTRKVDGVTYRGYDGVRLKA